MPLGHLYVFFGEISIQVFCPFFDWVVFFLMLSCMSCLYILEINRFSVDSFANIFSHSEDCLSVLFIVSFVVQKVFKSNQVPFVYFCFYFPCLRRQIQKKILLRFMSKSVLLMFSSRSFMVSHLTFRSFSLLQFLNQQG